MPPYTIHYTSLKPLTSFYGGGILLTTDILDTAIGALAALAAYKETEEPALLRRDSKKRYEVDFYAEDENGEKGKKTLMYKFWVEGADVRGMGGEGGVKSGKETKEGERREGGDKKEANMDEDLVQDKD
jgi:hypothetical protein